MKKFFRIFSLIAFAGFILVSCEKNIEPSQDSTALDEYYPIQDGKYRIYEVKDTAFLAAGAEETKSLRKEYTYGSEIDLVGRTISRLEIHTSADSLFSQDSTYTFTFSELWTQYQDEKYVERTEGNIRYLILKRPIDLNLMWDANIYNNLGEEEYEYTNLDSTVVLKNHIFQNCVVILQRYRKTLISDIFTYEVYAKGIGKIIRYDRYIKYNIRGSTVTIDASSYVHEEYLVDHNF